MSWMPPWVNDRNEASTAAGVPATPTPDTSRTSAAAPVHVPPAPCDAGDGPRQADDIARARALWSQMPGGQRHVDEVGYGRNPAF
eukprot:9733517-Heterocapsa_arctica.AAC.1